MVAMSGHGKIELFEDFFSASETGNTVADNPLESPIGPFRLYGQGINEVDAGVFAIAGLSGAGRLTTTDEDNHCSIIGTHQAFDVGLMGPLVLEARVQFNNLDTKEVFIGFSDVAAQDANLEGAIGHAATTTITLTASDLCGFWLSAELTEDEMWHFVHNGGTTAGVTDSTALDSGIDAVAGEWDVLRVEIDPNGTARWYINGVLKKTLEGAVSTTVDLAAQVAVEAKAAGIEELDIDYLYVKANRDWTR